MEGDIVLINNNVAAHRLFDLSTKPRKYFLFENLVKALSFYLHTYGQAESNPPERIQIPLKANLL